MMLIRRTISEMIDAVARERSSNEALIHTEQDVRFDYGHLVWEVDRIAKGFIGAKIQKGDKVALCAPNIPEWMTAFLSLSRVGAVTVPIDPGAGRDHLQFILTHAECRAIVMASGLEAEGSVGVALETRDSGSKLEKIFVIGNHPHPELTPWTELEELAEKVDPRMVKKRTESISPEDPVAIMYTSGTTGKPKGVVLDHLGLVNKSMSSTERQGIDHRDRLSLFFPLFHMFGNTCIALAGLFRGATLIMPCRTFDPPKILRAIHDEKCTALYASPSMLISLIEHPDFEKRKWKSLQKGTIGGAPCPMELMRRVVEDIGVRDITVGYGITETASWITMTRPQDPIELRVSTIGIPLECNEVGIVDPRTGENLPSNSQGEICTRGFLMKEYYRMPGATGAVIDRNGWFHTGDLGEMDEKGYVKVTGRLKDVIVRNGLEIYPVELEEIIYKLPEISEVQVFGFPHPERGQEVAAWVKLKEGSRLSVDKLSEYVKNHTEEATAPHFFEIVSEFPMTRSGKVQKFKLAELAKKAYVGQ
jgi:fatty-acyl-CoA synthase